MGGSKDTSNNGEKRKERTKEEQEEKDANRANKGRKIGGWTAPQMLAAYNE